MAHEIKFLNYHGVKCSCGWNVTLDSPDSGTMRSYDRLLDLHAFHKENPRKVIANG